MTEKNFWTCSTISAIAIAVGGVGSVIHSCIENHKTNKAIRKSIIERKDRLDATLADLEAQMVSIENDHKETQRKLLKKHEVATEEFKNRFEDVFGSIDDEEDDEEDDGLE